MKTIPENKTIETGQIYQRPNGVTLLITLQNKSDEFCYITPTGYAGRINECVVVGLKFIAQYPTWQEAINSKDFKNGYINNEE